MMGRSELLAIVIIATSILAVSCQQNQENLTSKNVTRPLAKCWVCSSDATGQEFCGDPFEGEKLDEFQKTAYYVYCSPPPNRSSPQFNQKNVCRKLKKNENGTTVIHRSCFWQEVDESKNSCENANLPSYITIEACEICNNTDGCNGASQYGPIATLMAIPIVVAKILTS